ncbi:MAG: hypothetical protein MK081_02180 [Flavobacteriales bacterium]|nr:hypothetical protein [Flavobacteriales bacterium]
MNRIAFCLFVLIVISSGCGKHRLEGDASFLVGKWKCVEVTLSSANRPGYPWDVRNGELGYQLEMLITDRGRICFYEDGKKTGSSRIRDLSAHENNYRFDCPGLRNHIKHDEPRRLYFYASHPDTLKGGGRLNFVPSSNYSYASYTFVRVE